MAAPVDDLIASDPYLTWLGLHGLARDGAVVVALPPLERHVAVPDAGVLHGGVIAAFLEATATLHLRCAGATTTPRTLEFTTDFLRPVPCATTFARAEVLRNGRRFASVRVDAWQEDDDPRIVAVGHGRFVLRAPS